MKRSGDPAEQRPPIDREEEKGPRFGVNADLEKRIVALALRDETFLDKNPEVRAQYFEHPLAKLLMEEVEKFRSKYGIIPDRPTFQDVIEQGVKRSPNASGETVKLLWDFFEEVYSVDLPSRDYVSERLTRWAETSKVKGLAEELASAVDGSRKTGRIDFKELIAKVNDWQSDAGTASGSLIKLVKPEEIADAGKEDWLWDGVVESGTLTLLSAWAKTGKSELTYGLAVAVSQGRLFLARKVKQGPVVILAVEEHQRTVRRRLIRYGKRPTDPILVHVGRIGPPSTEVRALRKAIEGIEPVLLVVDTLTRAWDLDDENSSREVKKELQPWIDLAHGTGVAVVLNHHDNKAGGEHGRQARGSGDIVAAVDQALFLSRVKGDDGDSPRRILRAIGRYEEPVEAMLLDYDPQAGYRFVGSAKGIEMRKADEPYEALLEKFPDGAELTEKQMEEELGLSRKELRRVIPKAVDAGVLTEGEPVKSGKRPARTWRLRA
jgi:AAA domain-containing protein